MVSGYISVICVINIDDWKCDQLRWRNYGCKKLKTSPTVVKTYYVFVNPDKSNEPLFKKYTYHLLNSDDHLTVFHYKGDHTVTNATRTQRPYYRTCPSVLRGLEKVAQSPSVAYKNNISEANSYAPQEYHSVFTPRNQKQVSNLQARYRQRVRISHDALYNLHELSYDLGNFVHKITTYPDLIVVCGLKHMLKELNRLIQIQSTTSSQLMSYDTTFQLGDFYVSPLLFRNILFSKSPVMPAIFLIHERKLKSSHEELMKIVAKEVPSLLNGKNITPLVTDDEKGFEAIDNILPKVHRFLCWNHVINSAKMWLRQHGAEVPVYVSDIRDLLHQPSVEDYQCQLDQLMKKWSLPFFSHYMNELNEKVSHNYADATICNIII